MAWHGTAARTATTACRPRTGPQHRVDRSVGVICHPAVEGPGAAPAVPGPGFFQRGRTGALVTPYARSTPPAGDGLARRVRVRGVREDLEDIDGPGGRDIASGVSLGGAAAADDGGYGRRRDRDDGTSFQDGGILGTGLIEPLTVSWREWRTFANAVPQSLPRFRPAASAQNRHLVGFPSPSGDLASSRASSMGLHELPRRGSISHAPGHHFEEMAP